MMCALRRRGPTVEETLSIHFGLFSQFRALYTYREAACFSHLRAAHPEPNCNTTENRRNRRQNRYCDVGS
jgi:hypothetical protein